MSTAKVLNLFSEDPELPKVFDDEGLATYRMYINAIKSWFNKKLETGEAVMLGNLAVINTNLNKEDFELFGTMHIEYNRASQPKQVKRITKDMILGRWQLNGETIILDRFGQVIDGKHRITSGQAACSVNPDLKIPTLMVFGVESSAMVSIDSGLNRPDYTRLAIARKSKAHSKSMTGLLKSIFLYNEALVENKQFETVSKVATPSVEDYDIIYQKNPELAIAASKYGEATDHIGSVKSMAFAYYLIMDDNSKLGGSFLEQLKTGNVQDEIILTLREKLIRFKKDRIRMQSTTITASIWKTWLRFKDGKKGGKRASLVIYNPETEYFPHPSMYVKK